MSSYGLYRTFATPSGQTSSIEGGGFCNGAYTVFNNTVDHLLYAENCVTGVNDFAALNDFGSIFNSARATMPQGGTILVRAGYYASVTTALFNAGCANGTYCDTGITLQGTYGGTLCCGVGSGLNGTYIVAKTSMMTMIQAIPASPTITCAAASGCGLTNCAGGRCPTILGNVVRDLDLQANGLAAIGIDFRMAETSTNNRFVDLHFATTGMAGGGFKTVSMVLDGNEDSTLDNGYFAGAGTGNPGAAAVDLQWQVPLGNVNIIHTLFGGNLSLIAWSQIISIDQSTINNVKIGGSGSTIGTVLDFTDDYLSNQIGQPGTINLNGQTVSVVHFSGCTIDLTSTDPLYTGAGTVQNSMFASNDWHFLAASNWNAGGATLTKQNTDGANHVRLGSAPTNFPFTIDGNGNF